MAVLQATRTKATSGTTRSDRLFVLELNACRIHSMNPNGSDKKTNVTDCRNCVKGKVDPSLLNMSD